MATPTPRTVFIACAPEALAELAQQDSDPLVIVGVAPREDGAYELQLRHPSRAELQAAIMARFRSAT